MIGLFGKVCRRVQNRSQQTQPPRRVNWIKEEGEEKNLKKTPATKNVYLVSITPFHDERKNISRENLLNDRLRVASDHH